MKPKHLLFGLIVLQLAPLAALLALPTQAAQPRAIECGAGAVQRVSPGKPAFAIRFEPDVAQ